MLHRHYSHNPISYFTPIMGASRMSRHIFTHTLSCNANLTITFYELDWTTYYTFQAGHGCTIKQVYCTDLPAVKVDNLLLLVGTDIHIIIYIYTYIFISNGGDACKKCVPPCLHRLGWACVLCVPTTCLLRSEARCSCHNHSFQLTQVP